MWKIVIQSPTTKRIEQDLKPGETILGRSEENDIVLPHQSVSRDHAKFVLDGETNLLSLHDLGSTNYSYLNGKRVKKKVPVTHNDQVRIGNFLITVISENNGRSEIELTSPATSEDTKTFGQIMIQAVDQFAVLLHDLSNQLVVVSELDGAIKLINNFIVRMLGANECSIYLAEQIPHFLEALNTHESIIQVVENKIPVAFNSQNSHSAQGNTTISNIVVPILVDYTIFGLIHVVGDRPFQYNESDLQLVVAVSHQAALTLQRLDFEEKLIHNALHDPVTNLPNRISLIKQLEYAIARSARDPHEKYALFFIDIDDFKLVNDNLGHVVGDKVLNEAANRLRTSCREFDLLVRFGGDEFAILYHGTTNIPDLTVIAQRLIEKINQPIHIDEHKIELRVSVGVTVSTQGYGSPEEMIRDADIAMYQAKALEGVHLKFYDKGMHLELVNLLQLQDKLRDAHKRGDFVLQYQPIIDLKSGQIVGLEALLRWDKPGAGLVTPDKFLPSMDTTGLLNSVEGWVVQTACSQLAWLNTSMNLSSPLVLAINLSEKQLRQPNLFDLVRLALEANKISPELLWLEVTEQSDIKNMEAAYSTFESFRAMGIKMCLDDFGTGFSTLSYLNTFPLDVLKVDKSFVQKVISEPNRAKLVKTIIGLGKNLDLDVVAEGVETQAQLDFLRQTDCNYAQGYLFSRPLDVVDIEALLKKNPAW